MVTYITVIVLVIILIRRNYGADRHLALFSAVFVTIQLMEFFAWLSLERRDRKLNGLVTRLILIFLWMQPLMNSYMAFKGIDVNAKGGMLSKYIMITCVIIFAVLLLAAVVTALGRDTFETVKGPNCHLVWKRKLSGNGKSDGSPIGFMGNFPVMGAIYIVGLALPLLFIKPFKKGLTLALLGLGLLLTARRFSSKEEVGSWWCWVAAVFVLASIAMKSK